jgi:hypothetical protein
MRSIWLSILTFFFMTQAVMSSEDSLFSACEQQLVQAGISCSAEEDLALLEPCIMDYLSSTACNIEVISENDMEICDEGCDSGLVTTSIERPVSVHATSEPLLQHEYISHPE